jgi:hypothetical protein
MTLWRLLGAWLWLSQVACTVTAVSPREDARPRNSCSSSDSCGKGESCLSGLCQSLNGELEAVLLTATPSIDSTIPHLTFVTHLGELPASGGIKDIAWPGAALVTGSIVLPKDHCYPSFISDDPDAAILASKDGTLPVTATLSLRQRVLGLAQQTYYAKTVTAPIRGYTFDVRVPSGEYDVYLVPPKRQLGDCVVPPQLFRGVAIGVGENSDPNGAYRFSLSTISKLDLHVIWPDTAPELTGWVADMIEPVGGNPISTELVLGTPAPAKRGTKVVDYAVPLSYSAVVEGESASGANSAKYLLRLRPPAELVAPTIYLERSALGLLQNPEDPIDLTIFTKLPEPVTVLGQLVRENDGRTVGGTLTLVSEEIYGVDAGVFGSYQTSVEVKDSGAIQVRVPPGKYIVQVIPPTPTGSDPGSLSILEARWDVPADAPVQYGKLLELSSTSEVTGQSRAQGAQVQAVPAPRTVLPFKEAFGSPPFVPRSTGALVDDGGRFVLRVDKLEASRVNVTVQAPEELGFGWFVRPGLELGVGDQDLGRVTLPLPAVLSGVASVQQDSKAVPLQSGTIRAYAYLDEDFRYTRDPTVAKTVIQVAETRADDAGAFRLLLPATIDAPK